MPDSSVPLMSQKFLPWVLLLFLGSGCAVLIYEIVWLQLLGLVIGSSGVSLGVLLGTFMGGMCLGSLLLTRFITPRFHPLRVYALLELGIGLFGIMVLAGLPVISELYSGFFWHGIFFRAVVAAVCLLPSAVLMGATLPVAARFVELSPRGVSWMGFFYGGNLLGAVAGCLSAGFYLLRIYDMPTASNVAVAINISVAFIAFILASKSAYCTTAVDLFSTYAGQASDLESWTFNAQINRDRNLRLQFLAGMGYNSNLSTAILRSILVHYRFPDKLFAGSPSTIRRLEARLQNNGRISDR